LKKVSLIIVNYNEKVRIGRAVLSCVDQTYEDVEVIIVDDGSDTETRNLYKDIINQNVTKKDIKLIQLERDDPKKRTVSRAFNAGLKASTGDYVAILGSDDYFDSRYVEKLIKLNTEIAFCNWRIIGRERKEIPIQKYWNFEHSPLTNYINFNQLSHECMLCSRKVVNEVGFYDERLPRSQDCDWIVRACLGNYEWKHIPDVLVNVEKHEVGQQKNYASIHGKTLWSLKNNLNISWILNYLKNGDPKAVLSFYYGIYDFIHNDKWSLDYKRSDFKKVLHEVTTKLNEERSE